jgi:EmrB/QacA subfamily drug resistance transporter
MDDYVITDRKRQRWLLIIASLAVFMTCLDNAMLSTALPTIAKDVQIGVDAIAYLPAVNLLIFASFVLTCGRLGDLKGYRRIFTLGIVLYGVGLAACGAAPGLWVLVLGRLVQALGATMIGPAVGAMIAFFMPRDTTGKSLGYLTVPAALGLSLGPALGGALCSSAGWRWVFFLNVPTCIFLAVAAFKKLPAEQPLPAERRFDLVGATLLFAALTPLLYALNSIPEDGWGNPGVLAGLAVFVVALACLIAWEHHVPYPLLELDLFRQRNFSLAIISGFLAAGAFVGFFYLLPFYLQYVRGLEAYQVGLYLVIPSIAMVFTGPLAGRMADRRGSRRLCITGMIMTAVTFGMLVLVTHTDSLVFAVAPLLLLGAAMGFYETPNDRIILSSAPPDKVGMASGVQKTLSNAGKAVGIVIFTMALQWIIVPLALQEGLTMEQVETRPDILVQGFQTAFYYGMIICLIALVLALFYREPLQSGSGPKP